MGAERVVADIPDSDEVGCDQQRDFDPIDQQKAPGYASPFPNEHLSRRFVVSLQSGCRHSVRLQQDAT
ncbi:hypothetical protein [Rhizobium sp. BR 362]|uniref:hypothetical protein n=1 Tax=Rhizobium sp. BR 362 TaxID=3040670 RepID=UPI002F426FFB